MLVLSNGCWLQDGCELAAPTAESLSEQTVCGLHVLTSCSSLCARLMLWRSPIQPETKNASASTPLNCIRYEETGGSPFEGTIPAGTARGRDPPPPSGQRVGRVGQLRS
jgi:hypothetical protein